MVLDIGDDDLIAFFHECLAKTVRHQVDRLGGAAGENNFLWARRVEQPGNLLPHVLEHYRGVFAQFVRSPTDGAIFFRVELANFFDDAPWLLRSGGVIEIHQRFAVYRLRQHGKIRANLIDIEWRFGSRQGIGLRHASPPIFLKVFHSGPRPHPGTVSSESDCSRNSW